jgi:hypothetical protein
LCTPGVAPNAPALPGVDQTGPASVQETLAEQARNIGAAMAVLDGRETFESFISCSLQQLRGRGKLGESVSMPPAPPLAAAEQPPAPSAAAPPPAAPPLAAAEQSVPPPAAPALAAAEPSAPSPAASCNNLPSSASQGGESVCLGDAQLAQDECVAALLALGKRKRKQRARPVKARPKTQDGAPDDRGFQAGDDKSTPCSADTIAFMERLSRGEAMGEINPNACRRLEALYHLLIKCQEVGLLTIVVPSQASASETCNVCIFGWSKLLVNAPLELNVKIREMIEEDTGGIWKGANGKARVQLRNPTWSVYELLRKIGVRPRFRGLGALDPGKHDMVYYKQWEFFNSESFRTARLRLAKGFAYGPEKGGRPRKLNRV